MIQTPKNSSSTLLANLLRNTGLEELQRYNMIALSSLMETKYGDPNCSVGNCQDA
jgi:hypothetical protein